MLVIRSAQIAVFEAHLRERFIRETAAHLVASHPEELATRQADDVHGLAEAIVRAAIAKASRLGAASVTAVRSVAVLLLGEGDDFDTRAAPAWVRAIADEPSLPGDDKVALLEHHYRRERERPPVHDDSDPELRG